MQKNQLICRLLVTDCVKATDLRRKLLTCGGNKWLREYLITLQKRSKWTEQCHNLKVGDFVLILGESAPTRCRYPYGIITEVKIDNDGQIRSATARMSNGCLRNRSIQKFVLLEGVRGDETEAE